MSEKKVAIMQPYIFPYIGYFQLLHASDVFVFYDDVNFIKKGWINRNRILNNGNGDLLFTIPLTNASQNRHINEIELNKSEFLIWRKKFMNTLVHRYHKAPYYNDCIGVVENVFNSEISTISNMARLSVITVIQYLGISKAIKISSKDHKSTVGLERAKRLIAITKLEGGDIYINPIGGKELYRNQYFEDHGIKLMFVEPRISPYVQFTNEFIGGLSILDVLMFNCKSEVLELLGNYSLF